MPPVEIHLKGQIDPRWSEWLGDLEITHLDDDRTKLSGLVADQAALFGILKKIRDLNLRLISVVMKDPSKSFENV